MTRLHITHILTDSNIGGAGMLLCYLIGAADPSEVRFSVILPAASPLRQRLCSAGAEVYTADGIADRSYAPAARRQLAALISSLSPDIVHTHASATGRSAARDAGVKNIVMTRHCSDMPRRIYTRFPVKQVCGAVLSHTVSAAIATDDSARDALLACGMPEKKITVIYNGAPALRAVPEDEKNALSDSLGIPRGAFTAGIFARLEPPKAHETLLRAAALCMRQTNGIYFLIAGDGSRRAELEALTDRYGIRQNVRFCGQVGDIAPYMALCDVNVNCSHGTETSNLAVIEGMSAGAVPVVSDWGGNARLADGCGRVYAADEPPALADILLGFCRDRSGLRFLSAAARRRYESGYTAARMARQTCDLYRSLPE